MLLAVVGDGMLMAKLADVLEDLVGPRGARSALIQLAQREGEDVLTHHLRVAYRRLGEADVASRLASWESCVEP